MMFKRMLCVLLAAVMLSVLGACGDSDTTETAAPATVATEVPTEPTEAPTEEPTQEPDDNSIDLMAFIREFRQDATLEPQTVFEEEGIRITAESLRYDPITGVAILFRVENNSEQNLLVQADASAVNGYMMTVDFSLKADAGKKAEGEMIVPYTSLALAGVDRIATVELALQLMDQKNYQVLTECEPAVITTSAADDYVPEYDEEGQTVWDRDGVKIVLKGIDAGHRVADSTVLIVYLYNGTDRAVSVQSASLWINGYEMTCAMTTTVLPGKHAVDVVPFFEMDLNEYGIEEIDTVELSFRIFDEASWTVIAETETVALEIAGANTAATEKEP